jgi:hypothetical protein
MILKDQTPSSRPVQEVIDIELANLLKTCQLFQFVSRVKKEQTKVVNLDPTLFYFNSGKPGLGLLYC